MHIHISSDASIDLQMHTTYSDGRWSAEELFDHLAHEGFDLVAVTDHDRVDTIPTILQLDAQRQVSVTRGWETGLDKRLFGAFALPFVSIIGSC